MLLGERRGDGFRLLLNTYIGKQVATCLYLYYKGNITP